MDFFELISSVNKISLIFFIITFGFLLYEIYLLRRERKETVIPKIPQFSEGTVQLEAQEVKPDVETGVKRTSAIPIIVTFVLMTFFGAISVIGFFNSSKQASEEKKITAVEVVESEGIKIYDADWNQLKTGDTRNLLVGDTIFIGIKTIPSADIDKARIRINEDKWEKKHEITDFNKVNQVFYITYTITSENPEIKVDAELHSKADGWPDEQI